MKKRLVMFLTLLVAGIFSISAVSIWDFEDRIQKQDKSVIKEIKEASTRHYEGEGDFLDLEPVLCETKDGMTFLEKYIRLKNDRVFNFLLKGFGKDILLYNSDLDYLMICAQAGSAKMFSSISAELIKADQWSFKELALFKAAKNNSDSQILEPVISYITKSFKKRDSMKSVLKELLLDKKLQDELLAAKLIDSSFLHLFTDYFYSNPASEREILVFAEKFLKSGAKVDFLNDEGQTPLIHALERSFISYANLLLKYKANPNLFPKESESALKLAVGKKNLELVKLLVEKGAKVNAVSDYSKSSALFDAARKNNLEILKYLLEHGADPNSKNKYGDVALNDLSYQSLDVYKLLLDYGADINIKDRLNYTPLANAVALSRLDVVKLFLDYKPDFSVCTKDGNNLFHLMMKRSLPHEVHGISDSGSWVEGEGLNEELVKLLVQKGVDINARNKEGYTPIQLACTSQFDLPKDVEILIKNGADISVIDEKERSLLMLSVYHPKVALTLLSHGADKNYVNSEGKNAYDTAMYWAINYHNKKASEILKILYDEEIDGQKNYSLQDALEAGHVDLAKKLLSQCKDINEVDEKGRFPLYCALLSQEEELIKLVLEKKPDLSMTCKYGTLLLLATKNHNSEAVKLLLQAGADPNERFIDRDGLSVSPLYFASFYAGGSKYNEIDFEIVKLLFKYGANPNSIGLYDEETDFMAASTNSSLEVLELYLQNGADIFVMNNKNYSPYSITDSQDKKKLIRDWALKQIQSKKIIAKKDIQIKDDNSFYSHDFSIIKKGTVIKVIDINPTMVRKDELKGFWICVKLSEPVENYYGRMVDEGWVFSADFDIR